MLNRSKLITAILIVLEILFGSYLILTLKQNLVSHLFMGGFVYGMAFSQVPDLLDKLTKKGEINA